MAERVVGEGPEGVVRAVEALEPLRLVVDVAQDAAVEGALFDDVARPVVAVGVVLAPRVFDAEQPLVVVVVEAPPLARA